MDNYSDRFGPASPHGGRLAEIALGITSDISEDVVKCFMAGLISGLKRGENPGPDLFLMVNDEPDLKQALREVLAQVNYPNAQILSYSHFEETQWLRNVLLVKYGADQQLEFLLGHDPLHHTRQISQLADYKNARIQSLDCPFRAGNVLEGDTFFLLGEDLRQHSMEILDCLDLPLGKKQIFVGRPPEVTGLSWQPVFDLDMFLSLGGRIPAGPDQGKYLLLLGEPVPLQGELPMGSAPSDFEAIAQQLEQVTEVDFKVHRIPLPFIPLESQTELLKWIWGTSLIPNSGTTFGEAGIWLTYNNVLAEITTFEKRVWMPSYRIPADFCMVQSRSEPSPLVIDLLASIQDFEEQSEVVWREEAGFQVEKVGPMNHWVDQLGAIRCLSTELRRES